MKRRIQKGDRDITKSADVIYRAAFHGEAMPKGWRVIVPRTIRAHRFGTHVGVGFYGGALGRCHHRKRIILMSRKCWTPKGYGSGTPTGSGWLGVLIHEMIHMRCPSLRHGAEFNRLVAAAYARVWES